MPVLSEAFGMTDDRNPYVYLTDGGHFENLGLYEMVLRRCHVIVACDGSYDPYYLFDDLGNGVHRIRLDFGIPIEFTRVPISAEHWGSGAERGLYFAVGRIRYSVTDQGAPDGVLLYVKPAVYGAEPRDILTYKRKHPSFPHQSAGDHSFDSRRFESYRALGSHVMDSLSGEDMRDLNLVELIGNAFDQLTADTEATPAADPKLRGWLADWLARHGRPPEPPQ
jgi:hypothetical protein